MGLDWNPGPKPRPGSENEFARLWHKLQSKRCWNRAGKSKKFEEITVTAFETLGTPRVGFDERANGWARTAFQHRVDVVLAAGRWCRFWSSRGHWLEAYW